MSKELDDRIISLLSYEHLPIKVQKISKPLYDLAQKINEILPECDNKTYGLRRLLQAKTFFLEVFNEPNIPELWAIDNDELDIELQEQIKNAKCKICLDDMLPQYGKAPHIPIIGGAILNTKDFPDNFEPELLEGQTLEDVITGIYYCTNPECKNHRNNYKE